MLARISGTDDGIPNLAQNCRDRKLRVPQDGRALRVMTG